MAKIVVNNSGVNSLVAPKQRSRLYCGYDQNTNQTTQLQGVWERFPYPSGGIVSYRNNDFTVDGTQTRFTYTGSETKWFDVSACCNVQKVTGANQTRTIVFQWRLNGNPVGVARKHQMSNEFNIITGNGQLQLSTGDYVEPFVQNEENDDKMILTNCAFNLREDYDYRFTS